MIQFYSPDIEKSLILPEMESAHCCRVLRKHSGDEIWVTDGKGNRFICEITEADPKKTIVFIKEKITLLPERNYSITLAVAPTKNADRMEWMVEKAVELGVDRIALLRCQRSERKLLKPDRLIKVMISAMKQSLSAYLPEFSEIIEFKDFISEPESGFDRFFGYCSETFPRKEFAKEYQPGHNVVIMIGPEGDFSPEEVETAVDKGFLPVTFGEKRLRTETAGVFAISAVSAINQRLK